MLAVDILQIADLLLMRFHLHDLSCDHDVMDQASGKVLPNSARPVKFTPFVLSLSKDIITLRRAQGERGIYSWPNGLEI